MAKEHFSMRGEKVNMEELAAKNSDTVAVTGRFSSVKMNARGDILGRGGYVNKRREQIEQEYNTSITDKVKNAGAVSIREDIFETPEEAVKRLTQGAESVKNQQVNSVEEPALHPSKGQRSRRVVEKED